MKKSKKIVSLLIALTMVMSIFNMPLIGYAAENGSGNYTLEQYKGVDDNYDYYLEKSGKIIVPDLYEAMCGNYSEEDGFYASLDYQVLIPIPEEEYDNHAGNYDVKSGNNNIIKISSDSCYDYYEYENETLCINFYPKVYETGNTTVSVYFGDELKAEIPVEVSTTEPELALKKYEDDKEIVVSELEVNLAEYDEYSGEWSTYVTVSDLKHPDMYLGDFDITWKSSNTDVVSVEDWEYGEAGIYINGQGTAKVTASMYVEAVGKTYTASLDVSVKDYAVRYSSHLKEAYEDWNNCYDDEIITDTGKLLFIGLFDSKNEKLTTKYSSDNESVVKIGRNGRIYPLGEGKATVTLTSGDISTEIKITVKDPYIYKGNEYIITGTKQVALYSMSDRTTKIPEAVILDDVKYRVTSITCDALEDYYNSSITIPKTVTSIEAGVFKWKYSIEKILVAEDNPVFFSKDGILFEKITEDTNKLIAYPSGKNNIKNYTIDKSTIKIESGAFANDALSTVKVHKDVQFYNRDESGNIIDEYSGIFGESEIKVIIPRNHTEAMKYAKEYEIYYSAILGPISNIKGSAAGTASINLSWTQKDKSGTTGYHIRTEDWNVDELLDGTSKTKKTIKNLKPGTGYELFICPVDKNNVRATYNEKKIKVATKPSQTKISNLTTSKKSIKVTWLKKKSTGYQVQIATNSKFTKNKVTYKTSSTSKVIKSLKKGKKYYVRVRPYKTYGTTAYGAWSKTKSIVCK